MAELTSKASLPDGIFGIQAGSKFCKSAPAVSASVSPLCPNCSSKNTWRNGHRNAPFGAPIQRWICRDCGHRFSDPADVARAKKELQDDLSIESKELKRDVPLSNNCQICDEKTSKVSVNLAKGTKNLVTELIEQKLVVPQKETYDIQDLRGAVVNFIFYMQQHEKAETTVRHYGYSLDYLIDYGANLYDPASVKDVLVNKLKDKTTERKYNLVKAYKSFMTAYDMDVKAAALPKYKPGRKLPYLPPEAHMDQLIASCSYEMAAFLQLLKETAARPIEAMRILWEELDFIQKKIPINHPAKGCNPRVLDMSDKLFNMLKSLPQDQKKVFIYKNERVAGKTFRVMRQHAIVKTGIKELRKITLYTFRYWRATVEFQETGREVPVMILLGHKTTRYIFIYVQLAHIYFGGVKKYVTIWVTDRDQETKANEEGYEYVRTDSKDGASLYRKVDTSAAKMIGHD